MTRALTERYGDRMAGVLSCYDRIIITGTVPVICYAEGMTRFLYDNGIRIFGYPQFAQSLRDPVRDGATSLAVGASSTPSFRCREKPVEQPAANQLFREPPHQRH